MAEQQQRSEDGSMTAEELKAQVLKSNFARRCTAYEEEIADLQVQNAYLRQQLQEAQQDKPQPAPPAPPQMVEDDSQLEGFELD